MGRRKSGFDIRPCACPAWGGYSLLIVARHAVAAAGTGSDLAKGPYPVVVTAAVAAAEPVTGHGVCLLYTSPSPRDRTRSRMPSSA